MGAMPEEVNDVIALLEGKEEFVRGGRIYYTGKIHGHRVVVVFSRWGKVAAAVTATQLIAEFGVTQLIFTGVAGAVDPALRVGDVILAKRLIQHDMDARPVMARYEIPLLGKTFFETEPMLLASVSGALADMVSHGQLAQDIGADVLASFEISKPSFRVGDIASGDRFFGDITAKEELLAGLPTICCVEMEGAAVAQVCYEYGIPYIVIRTISDTADHTSHIDFAKFVKRVAGIYSAHIVAGLLSKDIL